MANVTVVVSKIQEGKKNSDIVAAIRDHFTDPQVLSASDERYGKAFVNFATLEAATRAVELLNGTRLFGNIVVAKLQGGGATTAPVARPPQPPIATISGNPPIAVAAAIVAAPAARAPLVPGNQTVIISPIPLGSSQEAILDDVRAYGCQCTSASSVLPNGKVYINFESAESALDAVRLLMGKMVLGTTVTVTLKDPSSIRSSQTKVHAPVPLPAIIVPDKAAPPDVFRFAMAQLHKAEKFHDKKLSIARSRLCREKGAPPSFNGSANQTHEQMTNVFKIAVCELVGQQMFSKVVKKRIIDQFAVSSKQPSDVKETKFRLIREAYRLNEALPALALRSVIEDKIMEGQFLVIQGATGSGKSTQVPQYLADLLEPKTLKIICTQPRKVAAISLASRVASEWVGGQKGGANSSVGFFVGFRVGASKKSSKHTRVEYVTEGTLLQTLLKCPANKDPFEGVGAIIVDEAHERSITCDILLGILKQDAPDRWPNLKVVVTSATIDLDLFSQYFYDCDVLKIPGRMFPVDVIYCPLPDGGAGGRSKEATRHVQGVVQMAWTVHSTTESNSGDILCFLTGQDEVEKASMQFSLLAKKAGQVDKVTVLTLFGKQLPEEQSLVFQPAAEGRRKIIFATDVAETSITIDGVRHIVDCGLTKESYYDTKRNITVLEVRRISQSSADQRKGRAGRTSAGTCYRMYTEGEYEAMAISQTAQILSSPLDLTVLSLLAMKIDPRTFNWIEPPPQEAVTSAIRDLEYLGAISCQSGVLSLTDIGELASALQIDPKAARMIHKACYRGMGETACLFAGLFSVSGNFFWRGGDDANKLKADTEHIKFANELGDQVTMFKTFNEWSRIMNSWEDRVAAAVPDDDTETVVLGSDAGDAMFGDDDDDLSTDFQDGSNPFTEAVLRAHAAAFAAEVDRALVDDDVDDGDDASSTGDRASDVTSIADDPNNDSGMTDSVADSATSALVDVAAIRRAKAAATQAAKKWCQDHYINNKSVNMAISTKNDIQKAVQDFQGSRGGALWKVQDVQNKICSDEELTSIVVSAHFLNFAVRVGVREYAIVQQDGRVCVASCHPSSVFCKLANNGNLTLPKYVLFTSTIMLARTFLNGVTAMNEEWLKDESPAFDEFYKDKKRGMKCEQLTVADLSPADIRLLLGKGGMNSTKKTSIEERFDCVVQPNYDKAQLEIWCQPDRKQEIQAHFSNWKGSLRQLALDEVVEEVFIGDTRFVYGAGGEVEQMLFGNQFIFVNITNLPLEYSDESVRALASGNGVRHVRSVELSKNATGTWAQVGFRNVNDAENAIVDLDGDFIGGKKINAVPGGAKKSSHASSVNAFLVMSWATNASLGKANVSFSTVAEANWLLAELRKVTQNNPSAGLSSLGLGTRLKFHSLGQRRGAAGGSSSTLPFTNPDGSFMDPQPFTAVLAKIGVAGSASRPTQFVVRFTDLDPSIDEVDIKKVLGRNFACCSSLGLHAVKVVRNQTDNPTGEGGNEMVEIEELQSLAPKYSEVTSFTSFITTGRGGFYLHYGSKDMVQSAYVEWNDRWGTWRDNGELNDRGEMMGYRCGQPIRLEAKYQANVKVHSSLWTVFKAKFDVVLKKAERDKVEVRICAGRPVGEGSRMDVSTMLRIDAPSKILSESVVAAIDSILECSVYRPKSEDITTIMYTQTGRYKLKEIADKCPDVHIHWTPRRSLLLYGKAEDRLKIHQQIDDCFDDLLANFVKDSFSINRRLRKPLIDYLKQQQLPNGILVAYANSTALDVTGTSVDAITQFRAALVKKNFVLATNVVPVGMADEQLCMVCLCEVEEPFFYRSCKHVGCNSCLRRFFSETSFGRGNLPFRCFSDQCKEKVPLSDILQLTAAIPLQRMQEIAVDKYVGQSGGSLFYCPSPLCRQVLRRDQVSASAGEGQGEEITCDICERDYCLHCSRESNNGVPTHPDETCDDILNGRSGLIQRHVNKIREDILLLRCPQCKMAIFYFNGCGALTCISDQCEKGGCGAHFCCWCFQICTVDENHGHVTNCPQSPQKGEIFVPAGEVEGSYPMWERFHDNRKADKLKAYCRDEFAGKPALARKVLVEISETLRLMGFRVDDIMAAL